MDGTVRIWGAGDAQLQLLQAHSGAILGLAVTPAGLTSGKLHFPARRFPVLVYPKLCITDTD